MAKNKAARASSGPSPEFTQRMTEKLIERAFSGDDSKESVTVEVKDLPDYCGECRYFYKSAGRAVSRCHRNPPEVPEPLYDSVLDGLADFEYLRPPVMPEDVACGDGERRR